MAKPVLGISWGGDRMDLAPLLTLKAETYTHRMTVIIPGYQWQMPALQWLCDECMEAKRAGKLMHWLDYYNHFEGLD